MEKKPGEPAVHSHQLSPPERVSKLIDLVTRSPLNKGMLALWKNAIVHPLPDKSFFLPINVDMGNREKFGTMIRNEFPDVEYLSSSQIGTPRLWFPKEYYKDFVAALAPGEQRHADRPIKKVDAPKAPRIGRQERNPLDAIIFALCDASGYSPEKIVGKYTVPVKKPLHYPALEEAIRRYNATRKTAAQIEVEKPLYLVRLPSALVSEIKQWNNSSHSEYRPAMLPLEYLAQKIEDPRAQDYLQCVTGIGEKGRLFKVDDPKFLPKQYFTESSLPLLHGAGTVLEMIETMQKQDRLDDYKQKFFATAFNIQGLFMQEKDRLESYLHIRRPAYAKKEWDNELQNAIQWTEMCIKALDPKLLAAEIAPFCTPLSQERL